jgi:uncharacterized protein
MEFFLCVIGMIMVVEGIPLFGFPDKAKLLMRMILEQEDGLLRLTGGVLIVVGLLILFLARRGLSAS